jgi:hypothetical protein
MPALLLRFTSHTETFFFFASDEKITRALTTESVADRQQQQCSSVGEESGEVCGDTR